jgi:hypothetical protein
MALTVAFHSPGGNAGSAFHLCYAAHRLLRVLKGQKKGPPGFLVVRVHLCVCVCLRKWTSRRSCACRLLCTHLVHLHTHTHNTHTHTSYIYTHISYTYTHTHLVHLHTHTHTRTPRTLTHTHTFCSTPATLSNQQCCRWAS